MNTEITDVSPLNTEQAMHHATALDMVIVERNNIPSITSVRVDGEVHNLGIVKDFRKDPILAQFIPDEPERISFSWVRLLSTEILAVHSHPTASLIIVCAGEGYCTGDITGHIIEGSMVVVPPNCLHGFCGAGKNGFWGLSIQLESLGLYEDILSPRVSFGEVAGKSDNLDLLSKAHDFFMADFKKNAFFALLEHEAIHSPPVLNKFLDNIQFFSTRFQNILKVRLSHAQSEMEYKLASDHFEEEKGHDVNFSRYRGDPEITNIHPSLVENADWFEQAMASASDSEKIILMHFVLEGSGQLAHSAVYPIVKHLPVGKHFAVHQEEDEKHFLMGANAIRKMANNNIEQLLTILIAGWSRLNLMCACMANSAYAQCNVASLNKLNQKEMK